MAVAASWGEAGDIVISCLEQAQVAVDHLVAEPCVGT